MDLPDRARDPRARRLRRLRGHLQGPEHAAHAADGGTNAIHGIVVLGGLLVIGPAEGFLNDILLVIAIAFGTINVVGGFLVTDRMLGMFKGEARRASEGAARRASRSDFITLLYIVAFTLFIIGLRMLAGRGRRCAATRSRPSAWRSRSSRRCSTSASATGA